ncbi:hypothetical protein F5144DRAFT_586043 [Chaetomium tenue]|uniref:Uncharacterized protein n=1 Tax=Chaetomium tenue TaxID=1854479 RepID=A0ACB7NV65_9PEZI|nr:hypothetical protein F5144DRAFT_586043 [Chaetomium globosum]
MKAFLIPLAVMASSVMAQTTECGADYIVEACLTSETAKLNSCGGKDYDCLCAQWKNILTCYNNCPNDPQQFHAAGQRDIFCGYASQFPSNQATQAPQPTQTGATPAQNTQNAGADQGDSTEGDSASATTSSSGPADTNSAASLALNAGGVLAAVAGVFAVVL